MKVISGDDPDTVAALATQAGLFPTAPVHGSTLDGLSDPELDHVVADSTVFGRIAPEQKERIVASLRRQGRYVAMVGDGVNDARALKAAHVGVAMRSGSAVTRDVADIVLDRRLVRRAAAGAARGAADHQRDRDVDVGVPGARRDPGPGDPRGHDARAGVPVLAHAGRADVADRRRADAVPHRVGTADGARSCTAGQPRPVRDPGGGDHHRPGRSRSTPPCTRGC